MKTPESSKTNLDDLIQKIKSEGIEEAERKSEEIINAARLVASEILNNEISAILMVCRPLNTILAVS